MSELRIYNLKEAAELFRVSPGTLRNYVKARQLRAFRIGKEWRFTEEQLQDFAERGGSDADPLPESQSAAAPVSTGESVTDTASVPPKEAPKPPAELVADMIINGREYFGTRGTATSLELPPEKQPCRGYFSADGATVFVLSRFLKETITGAGHVYKTALNVLAADGLIEKSKSGSSSTTIRTKENGKPGKPRRVVAFIVANLPAATADVADK